MFFLYFPFCFDEIEHQVTLEELQNINILFQVGIHQVSFLSIHPGNLILVSMVDCSVEKCNPFKSYKTAMKNKFS